MANGQLQLILNFEDSQVKRRFDESVGDSLFMRQLNELRDKPRLVKALRKAFKEINSKNPHVDKSVNDILVQKNDELFITDQPVPWYFDEIGHELKIKGDTCHCKMRVKSCAGDLFVNLVDGDAQPVIAPFYHRPSADPERMTEEEKRERARGIADTILLLAPKVNEIAGDTETIGSNVSDLLKWFQIELAVQRFEQQGNGCSLDVNVTPTWTKSKVDESKQIICYQWGGENKELLIASPNVRDAIKALAEVWHNPGAKSVLLSAWTGSGKDELKKLLLYGLRFKQERVFDFAAPDLASKENILDKLARRLMDHGALKEDSCDPSAVFIDEIHHASSKVVREVLLRFLSDPKLSYKNDEKVCEIDCGKLFYLFAASEKREQLRALPPPDFWNRIQHLVEMKHPLLLPKKEERKEVARQYFLFFWKRAGKKLPTDKRGKDLKSRLVDNEKTLESLSLQFAEEFRSPLVPIMSIRTLQTLIARVFSRATYRLRTERIDDVAKEIGRSLDEWVFDIARELGSEINPEGSF